MRHFLCALFILAAVLPAAAAGYSDYYKEGGVKASPSFTKAQCGYISDVIRLLHGKDFSFVIRKDAYHWVGVGTEKGRPMIYIHDQSRGYNCRARVNLATGAITVLRGVDYTDLKKQGDADRTASVATEYLRKIIDGGSIFPAAQVPSKAAAKPAAVKKPVADKKAADETNPVAAKEIPVEKKETKKEEKPGTPDSVRILKDGNARFVSGKPLHPNQSDARRKELVKGQHPFATIVSCSDSRVPPELLFDQGLGDLFVVRTAGEVVQSVELGSIEYAAEHLHTPLVVVMGHKKCGAVDAAVKEGEMPDNIKAIASLIAPAVKTAKTMNGDLVDNAVRVNISNMAKIIEGSPVIKNLIEEKKIIIITAYYDLDNGTVVFGD